MGRTCTNAAIRTISNISHFILKEDKKDEEEEPVHHFNTNNGTHEVHWLNSSKGIHPWLVIAGVTSPPPPTTTTTTLAVIKVTVTVGATQREEERDYGYDYEYGLPRERHSEGEGAREETEHGGAGGGREQAAVTSGATSDVECEILSLRVVIMFLGVFTVGFYCLYLYHNIYM